MIHWVFVVINEYQIYKFRYPHLKQHQDTAGICINIQPRVMNRWSDKRPWTQTFRARPSDWERHKTTTEHAPCSPLFGGHYSSICGRCTFLCCCFCVFVFCLFVVIFLSVGVCFSVSLKSICISVLLFLHLCGCFSSLCSCFTLCSYFVSPCSCSGILVACVCLSVVIGKLFVAILHRHRVFFLSS